MKKTIWGTLSFCLLFASCCALVFVYFPANGVTEPFPIKKTVEVIIDDEPYTDSALFSDLDLDISFDFAEDRIDTGLMLYRQTYSKAAVEWFYTQVTGNRDVSLAILDCADKYDIPLSLAFALAYAESCYNPVAMHRNSNGSIDRGLFQLNDTSFPKLTESDFFDPRISAYYGMSHLRFCINTAGNEITALAMYNAGTNKVKNGNTPQQTLNYISKIETYRKTLEDSFAVDVLAFYEALGDDSVFLAKK